MATSKLIPIAIITALLVLWAGYAVWQQFGQLRASSMQPLTSPVVTSSFKFARTGTSQNSFINPNGKYSFGYPSAWNAVINKYNDKNTLFGPNADGGSGLGGVEIFSNYSSIDNFLEGIAAQFTNKTRVTIDGISGIRTQYSGASAGEQVVLLKDGEIYNIYVNSEKEQDINYFNQILSTFQFISPISSAPRIIGGDKDAHGCYIAAGYSWCEAKNKCLRIWEEKCEAGGSSGCIQVITPARNLQTGEVRDFPTPCDVPAGWEKVTSTPSLPSSAQ